MALTIVTTDNSDTATENCATFDDFWLLYPRRVARRDAMKAWAQMTAAEQMAAVVAMADWRRVWATKDRDYLPYPATWLRGGRWEDELPETNGPTSAAHVPAAMPVQGERSVMPDSVRALLAKLRAGRG